MSPEFNVNAYENMLEGTGDVPISARFIRRESTGKNTVYYGRLDQGHRQITEEMDRDGVPGRDVDAGLFGSNWRATDFEISSNSPDMELPATAQDRIDTGPVVEGIINRSRRRLPVRVRS